MRGTMSVLIVDDNAAFARSARAIIEEIHPAFRVHTVETARDALAFLNCHPPFTAAPRPAFVLLDYHLPDEDAPAVLERLRANPDLANLPVLVLSQADWEVDEAAATLAGATQFQVKPSRVGPLRELVGTFWREHVDGGNGPADQG